MPVIVSSELSELVSVPCLDCGGDGYSDDYFYSGVACATCGATGCLEVCPDCRRVPTVVHGLEVCGCTLSTETLELGRVA